MSETLKGSVATNRMQSYYMNTVAVFLFCAAAINLLSASSPVPVLNQPDALFQLNDKLALNSRVVLLLKGALELILSGYLLVGRKSRLKLRWIAWLATNLLIYRIALWQLGMPNFSDCTGNLVDWFAIPPRLLATLSNSLLTFMFAGSYGLLLIGWLKGLKVSQNKTAANLDQQFI